MIFMEFATEFDRIDDRRAPVQDASQISSFIGWTTDQPDVGDALFNVSHPSGDWAAYMHAIVVPPGTFNPEQYFTTVSIMGQLFPGSSGSAIVTENNRIVGQVLGGTAPEYPICIAGQDLAWGRFDVTYQGIADYLANRDDDYLYEDNDRIDHQGKVDEGTTLTLGTYNLVANDYDLFYLKLYPQDKVTVSIYFNGDIGNEFDDVPNGDLNLLLTVAEPGAGGAIPFFDNRVPPPFNIQAQFLDQSVDSQFRTPEVNAVETVTYTHDVDAETTDVLNDDGSTRVLIAVIPPFAPVLGPGVVAVFPDRLLHYRMEIVIEGLPPEIQNIFDDTFVALGSPYVSQAPIILQGTRPITWQLFQGPAGMTIDPNTGVVTWPNPIPGSYQILQRATNVNGFDDEFWTLHIVPPTAPTIADIPNGLVLIGLTYFGPAPTLTGGTPTISYSLVHGPPGMTIDPVTGSVSWPGAILGTHQIIIRATNFVGFDDENWLVEVLLQPEAPVITPIPDQLAVQGRPFIGPGLVLTAGTLPVVYSLEEGPIGMTINSNTGVVFWANPTGNDRIITIRATNTAGFADVTFNLKIQSVPIINPIDDQVVTLDTDYISEQPTLSQGTLPVVWTLVSGPPGMTINPDTGVLSWLPATPEGEYEIKIQAGNIYDADQEIFILSVVPPQEPFIFGLGSEWLYFDEDNLPSPIWESPGYNPIGWEQGGGGFWLWDHSWN